MKLYFRLLITLIKSFFQSKHSLLDKYQSHWRVLPTDTDLFGHMNNARYPMIMDLARINFLIRAGLFSLAYKNRWKMPVGDIKLEYLTALKPLEQYRVDTQLVHWDEKWFYIQQDFRRAHAPHGIVASGYVKALIQTPHGVLSTSEVMNFLKSPLNKPKLTHEQARKFGLLDHLQHGAHTHDAKESKQEKEQSLRRKEKDQAIAIVGIGCRFPGGIESPEDFWQVLLQGKDCIVDIPSDRWDPNKFFDASGKSPGRSHVHRGGILQQDIRLFDPAFFGITPREAEVLDPMQRLLLEVSWEAFEDAGINVKELQGKSVGVFIGGFMTDNMLIQSGTLNRRKLSAQSALASTLTMLSNRLSYFYDFRGPSFSLDTACSSSLVATHQACRSLWSGEIEAAVVGGVNIMLAPETQITMSKGQFLSGRGRCNTFDEGADGYVRGEGAGIVVLKPLEKALQDGDQIYSVIRGSAVNQDGKTNGITVPNGDSQMRAMRESYAKAGISPSQINYIEAHGTGTPVGDPIEAKALGTVLREGRRDDTPCPIGSLKTNVGHMEAAAGVAGMIKAALVLKNRTLVPHLHLTKLNPNIDLKELKLHIPTKVQTLNQSGTLYAGVNSFGYGGTNAHVTLSSPPEEAEQYKVPGKADQHNLHESRPIAIPLSAASEKSLQDLIAKARLTLVNNTNGEQDYKRIGAAFAMKRSPLTYRAWIYGENSVAIDEIMAGNLNEVGGELLKGNIQETKILFIYTGMGPQWWKMGRELFHSEKVFRQTIRECDSIFKEHSGWSILDALLADEETSQITRTEVAQPANVVIQVALTRLLDSWGVNADGVLGHSIGEVGAAWAGGGLTLEEALKVAFHRSQLQAKLAGKGGMLAVGISAKECSDYIDDLNDKVSIAAENSPNSVTLAGDQVALEIIAEKLEKNSIFNKFLKVEVPYHSPVMESIKSTLFNNLAELTTTHFNLPIISTVTGQILKSKHDANYWWQNVRQSVLFTKGIETALEQGFNTFVEIGPHPVLKNSILETAEHLVKM